ncbi:MAG: hypothetical protein HY719_00595 [Planctomycetes bacterium]|nr:hypothetical protein [Planctomycetota bacterium]
MNLVVCDEHRAPFDAPHQIRLFGWTRERFLSFADDPAPSKPGDAGAPDGPAQPAAPGE